jgi:hypothetical protein
MKVEQCSKTLKKKFKLTSQILENSGNQNTAVLQDLFKLSFMKQWLLAQFSRYNAQRVNPNCPVPSSRSEVKQASNFTKLSDQ